MTYLGRHVSRLASPLMGVPLYLDTTLMSRITVSLWAVLHILMGQEIDYPIFKPESDQIATRSPSSVPCSQTLPSSTRAPSQVRPSTCAIIEHTCAIIEQMMRH